ncbi:meiotic recombination protein REC102 [Kluyveromyces marxianus]|uniref:Meiotic recombination protein REC102 n=1 Tax=Kluyveromyces marxianus TaxID=4911 RepID=A0ABX6EXK3_KLUMA|nr:meiotic recombination protein REC102 [Kluyveromyces marxianus]
MSKLDALYLSNDDFSIVSEWNCEIFLQNLSIFHEDMIVIPSSNPYSKVSMSKY